MLLFNIAPSPPQSYLKPPHPNLGEVRDHHVSTSLPLFSSPASFPNNVASDDYSLSNLGRYLRASSGTPMEKMLTPVEERPTEVEEGANPFSDDDEIEDNPHIVALSSQKIDGVTTSRSGSGLSNPGASWGDSEVSSTKDSMSILSGGDGGERQGGDRSTEEGLSMLGRSSQQENAKDILSQSSEEECSIFGKMASSAEETQIADSSQRHDVFTDHTPTRSLPPKRNSLRDGEGGSQHSSPLSSTSRATVSSQSSYSEITGDDYPVGEQRQRKFSVTGKYARYEAYRSVRVAKNDPPVGEVRDLDATSGSQSSTQESVVTIIDEHNVLDEIDVGGGDTGGKDGGGRCHREEGGEPISEGVSAQLLDQKLSDIKDSLKHCDSGIDETPDANKTFKDGIRRFSVPPSSSEEGVMMMSDPLPLSRTLVASRESGLADSPDPETFADEISMLKVARPRPLHQSADNTPTHHRLRAGKQGSDHVCDTTIEIELCVPPQGSECAVDMLAAAGEKEEEGTGVRMGRSKSGKNYERPRSVPRSLENPSFSRYARTPIRDRESKFLRSGEFHEAQEVSGPLKYRSASMDRISSASSFSAEVSATERPPSTMSTSKSAAVLVPTQEPQRQPVPVQAKNIHPNQRFCVNPELSPPSPSSPSATQLNLHPDLYCPTSSPSDSPTTPQKHRRGKRIIDKLKPALRVFRIASNDNLGPLPVLRDPPQEADEQKTPPTPSTPDSSAESSPLALTSRRRVRMVSPEAVATCMASSGRDILRRSQSSEDILDSRGRAGEEEEEEGAEGGAAPVVGSLMVIPEPKYKRGRLFGKFKGKKNLKRGESAPVVLTKYGYRSMSGSSFSAATESSEQKRNKKHRIPHFV